MRLWSALLGRSEFYDDDRLGMTLDSYSHHRMSGVDAYRIRVGDYRVIYDLDRSKGILHLLAVGHRREVYRK